VIAPPAAAATEPGRLVERPEALGGLAGLGARMLSSRREILGYSTQNL
jgi:hypothetical protein